MPSNHPSSVVPFSSHLQSFPASGSFQWVSSSHQVTKVLEFQLQHQSFQWTFRTDFLWDWLVSSPCSPVQFSHSVVSDSLRPHEPQHARPPSPSPTPRVYPNPCPLSQWCHPTISSSIIPFSSGLQSFPASGSFHMSPGDSQESSLTPQFKNINSSHSAFFIVQLLHPYMTTGKTIALTKRTFVSRFMSLLFNMLTRLLYSREYIYSLL